jgi:EAL domain-containing protein (putative c-di-GMP-specific phosphodiesterase class I)
MIASHDPVDEMLDVIRAHLGMEVAFVSAIEGGRRYFRHVASAHPQTQVVVGDSHELEATYCTRIVSGALPPLTRDAHDDPGVATLPITGELGIRAYAGVPIPLADGRVYGTLCAFSRDVHDFGDEDAHALELAAALIAHRLDEAASPRRALRAVDPAAPRPLHAVPRIVSLQTGATQGHEALARFEGEEVRAPDAWFAMARRLGVDVELQRDAAAAALRALPHVGPGRFLAINLSEGALLDPSVQDLLLGGPLDQVVIELTEGQPAEPDPAVAAVAAHLRDEGARIALDDIGAGYASLQRVLDIVPELLKLDRSLVTGIWEDRGRQAIVQAMVGFARAVDAEVVAEGIEQQTDADALRILGVAMGQGFLLGHPTADLGGAGPGR